ncbi:MAG: T9SS type A sorting domain-containing protein [Ignavibacteriales bacterium]|nr:T9SS type A sorting domain-containing protein [Ignavibacteriales bacterium]
MMKKLLFLTICLVLVVAVGAEAQWKFAKYFPDTVTYPIKKWTTGVNNGIAIDPAGKIWIQSFAYDATVDSIQRTGGAWLKTGVILVFNPNGTPVSFSPIKYLTGKDQTGAAVSDTLDGSGYGLSTDPSTGNILSVKWSSRLWKIDYKTGKGITRIASPIPGYTSSLGTAMADNFGEVFIAPVVPGNAVGILNPDFTAAGTVTNATGGYARACAVSGDGNDVYVPLFDKLKIMVYHSDNGSLGPYVVKDSILGFAAETLVWNPKTGHLWTTSGNTTSGLPTAPYQAYEWYGIDVKTKKVVDSIALYDPLIPKYGTDPRPRGIAFTKNGDTAYVACFNGTMASWVQIYTKGTTYVEPVKGVVPTDYTLSQNYPNPFNPSTQISFSITKSGTTTLKVYDLMGREVSTLVNETLVPGAYSVKFDATNLSSGTYLYVLTSGGNRLTNKMLLLK